MYNIIQVNWLSSASGFPFPGIKSEKIDERIKKPAKCRLFKALEP